MDCLDITRTVRRSISHSCTLADMSTFASPHRARSDIGEIPPDYQSVTWLLLHTIRTAVRTTPPLSDWCPQTLWHFFTHRFNTVGLTAALLALRYSSSSRLSTLVIDCRVHFTRCEHHAAPQIGCVGARQTLLPCYPTVPLPTPAHLPTEGSTRCSI